MPTIELTPQVRMLLARGALVLSPGQWVRDQRRGKGRYLRTDPRTGVTYVSWVRPGDGWAEASGRFQRACRNAFVGRYRGLYEAAKAMREAERAEAAGLFGRAEMPGLFDRPEAPGLPDRAEAPGLLDREAPRDEDEAETARPPHSAATR